MNELKRSGVVDGRYGFAKDQARCVWTTGRTALSARWTFPYPEVLAMDQLLSGRRVLVVEDEMLVVMMIEYMLADLGCKSVTSAATVDEALALIDAQVFDAAAMSVFDPTETSGRSVFVAGWLLFSHPAGRKLVVPCTGIPRGNVCGGANSSHF
jgi:hypothetical protein